jgi:hypothetical protein
MRKERHGLANEVQRAQAFEFKYEKLKATHDELIAKCARLEAELSGERSSHAETRTALAALRDELAARPAGRPGAGGVPDATMRQSLQALRREIDRVLGAPGGRGESTAKVPDKTASDRIDIEFSS